jgi:hypothetical protein
LIPKLKIYVFLYSGWTDRETDRGTVTQRNYSGGGWVN